MNTSVWSDMLALSLYARSGGVDQVCEHGTLKKGFAVVGISFAVQVLFLLVFLSINNFLLSGLVSYPPLSSYVEELFLTFALPLVNAAGIWAYVRFVSNPELTFTRTATIVMYSLTYGVVMQVIRHITAIVATLLSYHGWYTVASVMGSTVSIAGLVLAVYFLLCSIHLFRKGLNTTLVHTIISCIVGILLCLIVFFVLGGFDGAFNGLPEL